VAWWGIQGRVIGDTTLLFDAAKFAATSDDVGRWSRSGCHHPNRIMTVTGRRNIGTVDADS
jgi:hypothetical protein